VTLDRAREGSNLGEATPLLGVRGADSIALPATVAAMTAVGVAMQWSTHLNHDLAWILVSAGRMLDGAVFGRDVIAANPPLAWFISMPAVLASKWFGWPVDIVFQSFVAVAAGAALLHCYWSMRARPALSRFATVAILAYFLFIASGRDYGQREHLSLIFVLPYLISTAARAEGRRPTFVAAILIGLASGVGIAFKPYFVAIPILVELVLLRAGRSPRLLVRPETAAMVATGLFYVLVVVVGTPEYLATVVPLALKVYWGFDSSLIVVAVNALPAALGFGALICLRIVKRQQVMTSVLLAAATGYAISYFIQFKGYTYHAMPMTALTVAASVHELSTVSWSETLRPRFTIGCRVAIRSLVALSLLAATERVALWYYRAERPNGQLAREIDEVIGLVDTYARHGSYLAISTHPFPGFPTALYVDSAWAGRTNSQIALPAVVKLRELGPAADPDVVRETEALARTMFLHDLSSAKPALLLVDVHTRRHAIGESSFDLLEFYRADPAIDAILRTYREMPEAAGFRVFARSNPS